MKKTATLIMAATIALAGTAIAQEQKKPLSPPMTATGTIAGSNVTVNYSAPSVRGRKIMGELVPYGQVWRTGANAATTLETDANLMIGDLSVPKGKYTLFTLPAEDGWTLIVNKQTGQWGTNYDASKDLGRVKMKVNALASPVETMTIDVAEKEKGKGKLRIAWENTEAWVPVTLAK